MKKGIKVKCAECGTWYFHYWNEPYKCPNCGSCIVSDWDIKSKFGKVGVD